MSAMTNFLEEQLCNAALRGTPYTGASSGNHRIALFTADPTDAGLTTNEVAYSGYARQPITFSVISSGVTSNTGVITFPALPNGNPNIVVTHWGIFDATSGGNMIMRGALTSPKTLEQNDSASFPIGALQITWD